MAMTLRLSDEGETRLTQLSDSLGKPKTQVVEDALAAYDARAVHREKVRAAFAYVEKEHAELLTRLADR